MPKDDFGPLEVHMEHPEKVRTKSQKLLTETLKKALSAKGQERWALLTRLASEHGYDHEDKDSCTHDREHLTRIGRRVIYLQNMTDHEYRGVRKLVEQRARITTSPSVIGNALAIGGSALGGAFLGYLLLWAGLPPLVMVPSVIIPPSIGIYEMVKESSKDSKRLSAIDASLEKHKEQIFYDDEAIIRFVYGIHAQSHHEG
jgi:hypothetical protein